MVANPRDYSETHANGHRAVAADSSTNNRAVVRKTVFWTGVQSNVYCVQYTVGRGRSWENRNLPIGPDSVAVIVQGMEGSVQ